jgi:DNA polymerase III subunit epsilon
VKISRKLYPGFQSHSLDSIIDRFNIVCKNRHRALGDAEVMWDFYKRSIKYAGLEKFSNTIDELLKTSHLPSQIKQEEVDDVHEGPGVYIFRGDKGVPLYVGKSINVKSRIKSHFSFSDPGERKLRINSQLKELDVVKTPGELSALLMEKDLIKTLKPLYNRMLRNQNLHYLIKSTTGDGYETISEVSVNKISLHNCGKILLAAKNKKNLQKQLFDKTEEYMLCPKILGIERSGASGKNRACFNYQIGKCKGACLGKESYLKYNLRFAEAFSDSKIEGWKFKGPIAIEERGHEEVVLHFINKWFYLGTISYDESSQSVIKRLNFDTAKFDWHIYKILRRHTDNQKAKIKVFFSVDEMKYFADSLV